MSFRRITKRYILFVNGYYPQGGLRDMMGEFDSVQEAKAAAAQLDPWGRPYHDYQDCYIFDREEGSVIEYIDTDGWQDEG